jgi:hypothetical protein
MTACTPGEPTTIRPRCEPSFPAPSPRNSGPTRFPGVMGGHPKSRSEQEGCQKWLLGSTAEEPSRVILLVDGYGAREVPRPATSTGGDNTL